MGCAWPSAVNRRRKELRNGRQTHRAHYHGQLCRLASRAAPWIPEPSPAGSSVRVSRTLGTNFIARHHVRTAGQRPVCAHRPAVRIHDSTSLPCWPKQNPRDEWRFPVRTHARQDHIHCEAHRAHHATAWGEAHGATLEHICATSAAAIHGIATCAASDGAVPAAPRRHSTRETARRLDKHTRWS
jgi:hypothetical protein